MRKLLLFFSFLLVTVAATAQTAMRMAHAPQHKAVASGTPVVAARPEGELKTYQRSGQCFYRPTDYQLLDGEQSGTIRIVYGADGKHVWMEGPVTYLDNKAWVEGTISGNTITLPLRENVAYYPEYDAYTQLVFLNTHNDEEEGILYFPTDEETTVATFTIDPDGTVRLNDSHEEHVLALVWSDTGDWTGFADYNSVYTPRTPQTATIPYFESLMSQESFDRFTVDDANNDGQTWQWHDVYRCAYNAYSQTLPADDWLFTPGLPMEAGRSYVFSMDATTYSDWCPEVVEVCVGSQPLGSEITQVVMSEFEMLAVGEYIVYDHYESSPFCVDEDGTYYVGIHAKSQPYMWYPLVRNVSVDFAIDGGAPVAIETVQAEAATDGSLTATLIFDVPSLSTDSSSLVGKQVEVSISRNGEQVATVSYPAGTKQAQYIDSFLARAGKYIYELTPSYAGHVGKSTETEVYVGYDAPGPVEVFTVKDTNRSLLFEWEHVTKGKNGGLVNTEALSYDLYKMGYDDNSGDYYLRDLLTEEPVRGTSYALADYNTDNGAQGFDVFAIVPHCDGFESDLYSFSTAYLLVGTPDTLPYHESVTGHHLSSFWTWEGTEQQVYLYYATESSDGDGEAMNLQADNLGSVGTLESGKIALGGETAAMLWFNVHSDVAGNKVKVKVVKPDLTEDVVKEFTTAKDFTTVKVPLGAYADEHWIRLYFETTFAKDRKTVFDDFNIKALHANDLAVSLSAPTSMFIGEQTQVGITVQNLGEQTVGSYELRLLAAGEVVSRTIREPLAFYEKRTFSLPYSPSIFMPESDVQLTALVVSDGDEDADNDASSVMLMLKAPVVTAPESVVASAEADGRVTLSWAAPAYSATAVVEDFEKCQPWSTDNFGEWTTCNADDCYAAGLFSDVKFPCQGKQFAYTVFDYDGSNVQDAYSGTRFLAAFYGYNEAGTKYAAVDDWLISPELPGIAQTISFYAWGRTGYQEVFDVMYSTTDARPESFRPVWLNSLMVADSHWERIEADLPEATRYFAIRRHNTSGGQVWMFGIDDISYIGIGDAVEAYNVYLDGSLVRRVPATETSFTFPEALTDDHHMLSVSAVYPGRVESAPRSVNYPDDVPEMELRTLYFSGIDYDMECISAYPVQVGIDGNEMYVKGIDRAFPDAWIHGTIADGKVVFPRNQFLGNVQAYTIYMQGLMPKTSEIVDFVMDYNAETSTLTSGDVWLVFNASQTEIIYQQVLYDITISPVGNDLPDVVTPPADLVAYDVEASALLYYEHVTKSWPAQLGFDGKDVYLKGSCYQLPEAWVKGTVTETGDLLFPMNQYMGQYGTFNCYLMGTTFDHTQGTVTMEDLVLCYDAATGEYVARTAPMFSTVPDFMSLLEINENFRLSAGAPAPEGLGTVLADLQQHSAAYDISGRRLRTPLQRGVTIITGRKFIR